MFPTSFDQTENRQCREEVQGRGNRHKLVHEFSIKIVRIIVCYLSITGLLTWVYLVLIISTGLLLLLLCILISIAINNINRLLLIHRNLPLKLRKLIIELILIHIDIIILVVNHSYTVLRISYQAYHPGDRPFYQGSHSASLFSATLWHAAL